MWKGLKRMPEKLVCLDLHMRSMFYWNCYQHWQWKWWNERSIKHISISLLSHLFFFHLPLCGCHRGRALLSYTIREDITWYDMLTVLLNLTPSITIRTLEMNLSLAYIAKVRLIVKWPPLTKYQEYICNFYLPNWRASHWKLGEGHSLGVRNVTTVCWEVF